MNVHFEIYGASDDLVEIEGDITAEINATEPCTIQVGDRDSACTIVVMRYDRKGLWTAKVSPLEEGVPMHEVRVGLHSSGYSAKVEFSVPQGTKIGLVYENGYTPYWVVGVDRLGFPVGTFEERSEPVEFEPEEGDAVPGRGTEGYARVRLAQAINREEIPE